MTTIVRSTNAVRCNTCRRLLFVLRCSGAGHIEIKCSRCKAVNVIELLVLSTGGG